MARNYFMNELMKTYERLFEEMEEFKTKVKNTDLHRKDRPQDVINVTNNPDTWVSIITPACNAERFLPRLHQALRNQSIAKHLEWVVVDDFSTDNSLHFYEQLTHDTVLGKISVYKNKLNLGAATSLRRGFSLASSDVLAWVSADDFYVSEDKLERDLELLADGFDVVFSKYTILGTEPRSGKKVSVPLKEYSNNLQQFADIFVHNYINGSSACFKKTAYLECGGMNEFLINVDGDFDLWARSILLGKKIGFSDTVVFNYQHSGQTSRMLERMAVGTNITRASYIRFLRQVLEYETFERNFKAVACQRYYHNRRLKNTLVSVLYRTGFLSFSDMKFVKRARAHLLRELLLCSIWLEELTGKQYFFMRFLNASYHDFLEMHTFFRNQIYELSNEFMRSETFQVFADKYTSIQRIR